MSLKADAFTAFRKVAMTKRKDRILLGQHSEVVTVKAIADALKNTTMVNGIQYMIVITLYIVSRGRTPALMAGPNPKKRKLNDGVERMEVVTSSTNEDRLREENERLH